MSNGNVDRVIIFKGRKGPRWQSQWRLAVFVIPWFISRHCIYYGHTAVCCCWGLMLKGANIIIVIWFTLSVEEQVIIFFILLLGWRLTNVLDMDSIRNICDKHKDGIKIELTGSSSRSLFGNRLVSKYSQGDGIPTGVATHTYICYLSTYTIDILWNWKNLKCLKQFNGRQFQLQFNLHSPEIVI